MMTEKRVIAAWLPFLAFGMIVLSLLVFAEIADGIGPNDDLHLFDLKVAQALLPHVPPGVLAFLGAITWLGAGVVLAPIGVIVGGILLARRKLVALYAWVLALTGSGLLNVTLKGWFMRDRPGEMPLVASWSFPSAHAMNSLVAYGMLAYLLSRVVPRRLMPALVTAAITIPLLVGASRVVLRFHYFTDVIAGFAAGLAWLTVCIAVAELRQRWEDNSAFARNSSNFKL